MAGNLPTKSPDHWFEPIAEHLGPAYLRYSFTKGTAQEVDHIIHGAGAAAGGAGARRRLRTRTPRPRARPAGDRRARHRHLGAVRRARRAGRSGGCDVRAPRRQGDDVRRRVRRRHLPLSGSVRVDDHRRWRRRRRRRHGAGAATRRPARAERVQRLLRGQVPRRRRRSMPMPASPTSAPRSATPTAPPIEVDLWTGCYTPRELRLLLGRHGLDVERISSVEPGAYGNDPPTTESPEFLVDRARRALAIDHSGSRYPRTLRRGRSAAR